MYSFSWYCPVCSFYHEDYLFMKKKNSEKPDKIECDFCGEKFKIISITTFLLFDDKGKDYMWKCHNIKKVKNKGGKDATTKTTKR